MPFDIAGGLNNLMQNDKPAIMQIRCKFGSLGETERQFHSPHGFCMGPNEEIIVADTFNHRIQVCTSILPKSRGGGTVFERGFTRTFPGDQDVEVK